MDFLSIHNPAELIGSKIQAIDDCLLRQSPRLGQSDFEKIGAGDLERLFGLYDENFFDGWLTQTAKARTGRPVRLRPSGTMTSAGGKTLYRRRPGGEIYSLEIAIAVRLLFMTFQDVDRPVVVGGLLCRDRLAALERIMEHEIIHLIELLVWDESSCRGQRFIALANRIFGHTDTTHALVTPREHAAARHGIRVGSVVRFYFEGRPMVGRVNRINQRASVLVEDGQGTLYTDGKKYLKFYMPMNLLAIV